MFQGVNHEGSTYMSLRGSGHQWPTQNMNIRTKPRPRGTRIKCAIILHFMLKVFFSSSSSFYEQINIIFSDQFFIFFFKAWNSSSMLKHREYYELSNYLQSFYINVQFDFFYILDIHSKNYIIITCQKN